MIALRSVLTLSVLVGIVSAVTVHDSLAQPRPDGGSDGSAFSPAAPTSTTSTTTPTVVLEPSTKPGTEVIHVSSTLPEPQDDPQKTAATVSVVTRQDIEALPSGDAQVLSDVIATQAGVVRDVFGLELFHIHGLEYGIAYQIDGIPIMYGAGESFADVIPTRLVENVKLITNGIPAEYPANGGVVELTTRRASGEGDGDVQLVYGTFNTVKTAANYSQSFRTADILVGGDYFTSDYGLNAPQVAPIVHDAETAGAAFGKVDFRPSAQDHVELLTEWQDHHYQIPIDTTIEPLSDAPPGSVRGSDMYGNAPPVFVPFNANPTEHEQDLLAAVSYTHSAADGQKVQISPYFRYATIELNCDPEGSLGPTADPDTTCTDLSRRVLHEGTNATYAWNVGPKQHWKAGLLLDDAQESLKFSLFTNQGSVDGGPNPSMTKTGADDINALQGGAFVQDAIAVGKLTLFPGARVDVQNIAYGAPGVPNVLMGGATGKLGFTYPLSDRLLFHASGGYISATPQTLDAPVVAEAFGLTSSIPSNDSLKAEHDEQLDAGLTYRIPRWLKLNGTAWGRYSQNTIDWNPVGPSAVLVNYNWDKGRAIGVDLSAEGVVNGYLTAFANVSPQLAETEGVNSAQYLFAPSAVNFIGWSELDHTQFLTVNLGADLHEPTGAPATHLAVLVQYGSGLRTGPDFNENLPSHCTVNVTLRHEFDNLPLHPQLAIDVLNAFDDVDTLRIADGYFGSSYGPPRRVDLRLIVPLGGVGGGVR